MKIILSRKGFDSSVGKVASPIFSSGELYSLPIPEPLSRFPNSRSKRYSEIQAGKRPLGIIVSELTAGKVNPEMRTHLDPDLNALSVPRPAGWRPIFGQAGAAERHLQNQGVKEGDVFLFYGWFKQVEQVAGRYQYVKDAPDLHVIFGWLQIERRISVDNLSEIPLWALDHPHCKGKKYGTIDSVYISTEHMQLLKGAIDKPGAGVFRRFHPALCLTARGRSRSHWRLPGWFYNGEGKSGLSYHLNSERWTLEEDNVLLKSVGRGQEFVLDCEEYPKAIDWLYSLLCLCD